MTSQRTDNVGADMGSRSSLHDDYFQTKQNVSTLSRHTAAQPAHKKLILGMHSGWIYLFPPQMATPAIATTALAYYQPASQWNAWLCRHPCYLLKLHPPAHPHSREYRRNNTSLLSRLLAPIVCLSCLYCSPLLRSTNPAAHKAMLNERPMARTLLLYLLDISHAIVHWCVTMAVEKVL